jgi:hypothetical protein
MNTGIKTVLQRSVFAVCTTLTLSVLMPDPGFAQRYLETKRQKCPDRAKVTTPGLPAPVGAYEARSADVTTPSVTLQCEGQPQQPVECPPGTNRILIDRSQGGGVFSIICLRK